MRMSVENGIVAFIVLVVVVELVIEGLEDKDRFAEDEDDYDIAAFTNNSIFSASRTLNLDLNHNLRGIKIKITIKIKKKATTPFHTNQVVWSYESGKHGVEDIDEDRRRRPETKIWEAQDRAA